MANCAFKSEKTGYRAYGKAKEDCINRRALWLLQKHKEYTTDRFGQKVSVPDKDRWNGGEEHPAEDSWKKGRQRGLS